MIVRLLGTTALCGALALSLEYEAAAQGLNGGQTFVFGDSLSDAGSRFAQTGGRDAPFARQTIPNGVLYNTAFPNSLLDPGAGEPTQRFSNGPIHIDRLTGNLTNVVGSFEPVADAQPIPGTSLLVPVSINPNLTFDPEFTGMDGFNFAHGGATSGLLDADSDRVGFLSQVQAFATMNASGAFTVEEGDGALVWIGGNDFFNAAEDGTLGEATVRSTVQDLRLGVGVLAEAGINSFVVYNLPDLGRIPLTHELAEAENAPQLVPAISQVSVAFNEALTANVVAPLRAQGHEVITVDIASLFADFVEQPNAYGLRLGTGHCFSLVTNSPTGQCETEEDVAETTFLDSMHPTASAQAIVASFARGTIQTVRTGPSNFAAVPELTLLGMNTQSTLLAERLRMQRAGRGGMMLLGNQFGAAGASGLRTGREDSPLGVFIGSTFASSDREAQDGTARYDFDHNVITVGADYTVSNNLLVGAAVSYGEGEGEIDGNRTNADLESVILSLYASLAEGPWFADAVGSIGFDSLDLRRRHEGPLDSARSDPNANTYALGLNTGYDFQTGPVTLGPRAGLRYLTTSVDGFAERGAGALNLTANDLDAQTVTASFGAEASALYEIAGVQTTPRLGLAYEREVGDESRLFSARLPGGQLVQGRSGVGDRDAVVVDAGVSLDLGAQFQADLSGRTSLGRDGSDRAINASLGYRF